MVVSLLASFQIPQLVRAEEPLTIFSIRVSTIEDTAIISWETNRTAAGQVDYGRESGNYTWTINVREQRLQQTVTLRGLDSEMNYFFRIRAYSNTEEVYSFQQQFKTAKVSDNTPPTISRVHVPYVTGRSATIQWQTNEESTTEVEYGETDLYGAGAGDGRLVLDHDITIRNLKVDTTYHFRVKSKDKDGNIRRWQDMTFRTFISDRPDTELLYVYGVQPTSANNQLVGEKQVTVSWQTNKLAEGWINYGLTPSSLPSRVIAPAPRDFQHAITIPNLQPGTTYYFQIVARDVFGRVISADGFSFTTKQIIANQYPKPDPLPQPTVLGSSTCAINFNDGQGFYGSYYNHSADEADFESPTFWTDKITGVGRDTGWYNQQYFTMDRIDRNLRFGDKFFPINTSLPGDPFHFAVNWEAIIEVPTDGDYNYSIHADDSFWVLVDGQVRTAMPDVRPARTDRQTVRLTAGYHHLQIFYAERHTTGATFSFEPDTRWKVYPLPLGCTVDQIVAYNQNLPAGGSGTVLGTANVNDGAGNPTTPPSAPQYACDPTRGYTKFKQVAKTADSPDIWAILETGQRHYITSPAAFADYGCGWGEVKTISRSELERHAVTNLVRTPADPNVFHLFQRGQHKWLKLRIASPTVFVSYPNNYWGNVARISPIDLTYYPDARFVKTEASPTIYSITSGQRQPIASMDAFHKLNADTIEIVTISETHLNSFDLGPTIN